MKTLEFYNNDVLKIFEDYYDKFEELTEDEKEYIDHLMDYEMYVFAIVDNKKVVVHDKLNGDVYSEISLEEFFTDTLECVKEEIEL